MNRVIVFSSAGRLELFWVRHPVPRQQVLQPTRHTSFTRLKFIHPVFWSKAYHHRILKYEHMYSSWWFVVSFLTTEWIVWNIQAAATVELLDLKSWVPQTSMFSNASTDFTFNHIVTLSYIINAGITKKTRQSSFWHRSCVFKFE